MATAALWHGLEAFAGGSLVRRPAGSVVIVDKLPSGVTCRAYGDKDPERPEWLPLGHWRGEATFKPKREMQADKLRQWWHFDAQGKSLDDLAKIIAEKLRGFDNPLFQPEMDLGSYVVVTNCEKVRVPGKMYHYKLYLRNLSRRPGHIKVERFKDLQERFPERIIMKAVWGNMARNPTCRRIFKDRLKLFTGPNHCYYDQNPIEYPMWKVPDITFEDNLRHRDRLSTWVKTGPAAIQRARDKELKQKNRDLNEFKQYLAARLDELGEDESRDKSVPEFLSDVQVKEAQRVREEWGEKEAPRKKVKFYPGTRIPVQKVEVAEDKRKDINFWVGKV